jgi:hypothetical protein
MKPFIQPVTGTAIGSFRPTRRSLLLSTAAMIVSAGGAPAFAQALDFDFLALSRAVTGHDDIDAVTASRIYAAMEKNDPGFAVRVNQLADLAKGQPDPKTLLAAAEGQGLKDTMLAIVSAWYTGTVGDGSNGVVVSYVDALMYRPVQDGMTVPTYCSYGPLWWTRPVPPAKVTPPLSQRLG